ncbi:hypothetical protein LC612_30575 [Nostoc sp. CHAB 5834]|nr:hypothetical protein [Nostoc sp. CHAB 5834]
MKEKEDIRRPTVHDFKSGAKFVTVHVDISTLAIELRASKESSTLKMDRGDNIRLHAHGTIENIQLGVYQPHSSGGFSMTGFFIDYEENKNALLEAAKVFADEKRQALIVEAQAIISKLEALEVAVLP